MVDLLFPARGDPIPTDHAYRLYAALTALLGVPHIPQTGVRFAPLTGDPDGNGRLRLGNGSVLRLRVPVDAIAAVLPLTGRTVYVGPTAVRFGPPTVVRLAPAPTVRARVVTFKNAVDPIGFLAAARLKLASVGVGGEPGLPVAEDGPRAGEPLRRVVRVKGRAVVGYALVVAGLSAVDSLRLQEEGLGGRTRIGCGFFLPFEPEVPR